MRLNKEALIEDKKRQDIRKLLGEVNIVDEICKQQKRGKTM